MDELRNEIEELKNTLKFYHGEPIRKAMIDNNIEVIESKIEELFKQAH